MSNDKNDKGDLRKLTVTSIDREITSGVNEKSGAWSLKAVSVLDASGHAINVIGCDGKPATFKTFADLTPLIGKLDDFYVKREDHEKYGTSFMLSPKASGLQLKVDALTVRVEQLEAQVAQLGGSPNSSPAVGQQPPAGAGPAGGSSPATSDNDIPF